MSTPVTTETSGSPAVQVARWKVWLERVCRWALGLIFIYAAYSKIWDPSYFAEEISYYHMLPKWGVNWMAIFLPWLELVCGLCLLTGLFARGAMLLVIGMLVVFTYAIAHAVSEGRDIRCGCFGHGADARRVGLLAILEDLAMLAAGVVSLWLQRRPKHDAPSVGASTTSRSV
jgi:uncharacterized membrane protein YphA (DoxX/SURF4 family)